VEVHFGGERIAVHQRAASRHQLIRQQQHHEGIPLGPDKTGGKILVHMRETAPSVEARPLSAYETLAGGAQ
jgi:hypothetical protein